MSQGPLSRTYVPNPLLKSLYSRFFDRIKIDEEWVSQLRAHVAQGTVVYILRNRNIIDFLALDYLTKRYGFPPVRFVNDMGLGAWNPMSEGLLASVFPKRNVTQADSLRDALSAPNGSAILFLKRPPSVIDSAAKGVSRGRGIREGEELMRALINLQRTSKTPILLVPQIFVWTKRPDTRGTTVVDWLLGPREWPSATRVIGQFLTNYRGVSLRAAEPINLKTVLGDFDSASESAILNKVVFTALRRIERERLAITGPARKDPERTRQDVLRSRRFQSTLTKLYPDLEARTKALREADEMLSKMQAIPDGTTASALDVVLDRIFQRIYHGIDVDQEGLRRIQQLAKTGNLVLLPSHKSYIDFLVVSYVFYKANIRLPVIVAGDNFSFFPMGPIFRRAGAFFIRRSFGGDRLYTALVDAYVRRLFKDGHSMEVFLEGQRSRTGKLLNPKFGLLSMIVSAAQAQETSAVHFVPISIGYERIIETSSYHHEIAGGEKVQEDAAGLLSATEVLRHRYGRINLQFGQSLTLPQLAGELGYSEKVLTPKQSRTVITRLGNRIMDEINRVTAVTPGALTALVLLNHHRRGLPHEKLILHAQRLHGMLCHLNARCTPALTNTSGGLRHEAIREAVQMFADADMVEVHTSLDLSPRKEKERSGGASPGAIYSVVESRRVELDTSKNIIVHFFVERALLSTALLPTLEKGLPVEQLNERVQTLSRLLKYEFRFRADKPFDEVFQLTLDDMCSTGELSVVNGRVSAGPGKDGWSGVKWVLAYSAMIRNFIEAYRVVARSLSVLLDEPIPEKDLMKLALNAGSRMYLAGEIERPEATSKPTFQNALASFQDQGVLKSAQGKLMLSERHSNEAEMAALEAQVALFLERDLGQ